MIGFRTMLLGVTRALCVIACSLLVSTPSLAKTDSAQHIKQQILGMAQSFTGEGDPDFSKQHTLEKLVGQLLKVSPQPPVKDRLPFLYGTWKQVWGPYDYRSESRGVDPELGIEEIYQSIFPEGYYYNISPLYRDGQRLQMRTGLLRGEYEADANNPNRLKVHFTSYAGIEGRPADGSPIWALAPLAEAGTLDHTVSIVPWLIVRLFFGTGALDEVYTDQDLRICYGSDGGEDSRKSIYIMTKVK